MSEHKRFLEDLYTTHHAQHERYGFTLDGAERGRQFAAWVGTGKRVLDIGCRDGTLTAWFARGNEVVGIDIDRAALERARSALGIETAWVDVDNEPLPYSDRSFDVVTAGEVLEHLQFPGHAMQEVVRVLRPDGCLIGSTSNEYHWTNRVLFLFGRPFIDETHLQLFTYQSLCRLLEQHFAAVQIQPLGGIGGRRIGVVPPRLSQPLVRRWPQLLAHDWLFRAFKGDGSGDG